MGTWNRNSLTHLCVEWVIRFSYNSFVHSSAFTKCERQRADNSANAAPGAFIPRCKANGNFEPAQCLGSVCYCVNINGIRILGTKVNIGQGRPKCQDPGWCNMAFTLIDIFSVLMDWLTDWLARWLPERWTVGQTWSEEGRTVWITERLINWLLSLTDWPHFFSMRKQDYKTKPAPSDNFHFIHLC